MLRARLCEKVARKHRKRLQHYILCRSGMRPDVGHEGYTSKQSPTAITVPCFGKETALLQGCWDLSGQPLHQAKADMTHFGPWSKGGIYQVPCLGATLIPACGSGVEVFLHQPLRGRIHREGRPRLKLSSSANVRCLS